MFRTLLLKEHAIIARWHFLLRGNQQFGQKYCPFLLTIGSDVNYFVRCSTTLGGALPLPFLGVSSLNFGPLFGVAFFFLAGAKGPALSHLRDQVIGPSRWRYFFQVVRWVNSILVVFRP
ncbi:hypothetical protein [Microvirga massiliensis]|uniref:hypothetical protein n=1 Tax=Microvirga massiliensis TaxID=1033741 RepID=UPI00062B99A4|nr:hypothetical protein [Microvirga massiliensis]